MLRSEIPGANLYLLNPSGVMFGPKASLDVCRSFYVSTADYLRLAGARFFARLSDTSTLSVASSVAFGFLGPALAAITVQGSQIMANAFAGNGGRIALTASQALLADPSSAVTASSTLGLNGEVHIQAPVTNLSGILMPLTQVFARATELLSTRYAERLRAGTVSSLAMLGHDGVPARPGGGLAAAARPRTSRGGGGGRDGRASRGHDSLPRGRSANR